MNYSFELKKILFGSPPPSDHPHSLRCLAIVARLDQFLLIKPHIRWALPSLDVSRNKTVYDSIMDQLQRQLGIVVMNLDLLRVAHISSNATAVRDEIIFIVRCEIQEKLRSNDTRARWFSDQEIRLMDKDIDRQSHEVLTSGGKRLRGSVGLSSSSVTQDVG